MKIYRYFILIFLLSFSNSCKKELEEINTNPNSALEVQPELLLRQVLYNYGDEMAYEGFVAGNLLSQHFTAIDFNLFDRHNLNEPQFGGNPWPVLYRNLRDNNIVLDQARSNSIYEVYEGPALVMKAYLGAALTDIYGDVPFFDALNGLSGVIQPAYDSQESIYLEPNGILDLLDQAVEKLENYSGTPTLKGDILFNGNLSAWIKFANSLKIKALVRISDKIDVAEDLQALADSQNYMTFNSDNATFDFTGGQPNNFRMANLRAGDFNLFIMSETADEIFSELSDPRMAKFYRPTANDPDLFLGLLNGPDASVTSISVADYSLTGTIFRENTEDLNANFMTAWETHFLLAEAAENGWINSDAQMHYDLAVQMAFDYWQTPLPTDYLTSGPASYMENGANPLEQIITQKWIANSINGYESWIEFRRTGFPILKTVSASENNDLIPVRMPYPTDEAALNSIHYNAATAVNGNSINYPVWWDEE